MEKLSIDRRDMKSNHCIYSGESVHNILQKRSNDKKQQLIYKSLYINSKEDTSIVQNCKVPRIILLQYTVYCQLTAIPDKNVAYAKMLEKW